MLVTITWPLEPWLLNHSSISLCKVIHHSTELVLIIILQFRTPLNPSQALWREGCPLSESYVNGAVYYVLFYMCMICKARRHKYNIKHCGNLRKQLHRHHCFAQVSYMVWILLHIARKVLCYRRAEIVT